MDSNGNKLWRKNYGGTGWDYGTAAIATSDGGFLLFGETDSFTHGSDDLLVYKVDSNGNKQWRKNYGGTGTEYAWWSYPSGEQVHQTLDGGYIFIGMSTSFTHGSYDFLVYKVDANGNKQWRKNYGGTSSEYGYAMQLTSDGGYIITGSSNSFTHGYADFLVYKLDANGNKQWRKNYGGTDSEVPFSIKQTVDGGYVVAGRTYSFVHTSGYNDFLLYKIDSNGNKVWRKNYGR